MTNLMGSERNELMAVVVEAVRSVSAKARATPITPTSLLLEELALDSLDLVAGLSFISKTTSAWKSTRTVGIPSHAKWPVDDVVSSLKSQVQAAALLNAHRHQGMRLRPARSTASDSHHRDAAIIRLQSIPDGFMIRAHSLLESRASDHDPGFVCSRLDRS